MKSTMALTESFELVTFRGGMVAPLAVVARLLDLEGRGAKFELLEGEKFRVTPPWVMTAEDRAFLRENQRAARQVIAYQADDRHLYTDAGRGEGDGDDRSFMAALSDEKRDS